MIVPNCGPKGTDHRQILGGQTYTGVWGAPPSAWALSPSLAVMHTHTAGAPRTQSSPALFRDVTALIQSYPWLRWRHQGCLELRRGPGPADWMCRLQPRLRGARVAMIFTLLHAA